MKIVHLAGICALIAPSVVGAQMAAPPTAEFVKKAGASDLFEREEGKVMSTSTNADVRAFAQHMVTDHTKSTAEIKAAARAAKVRVGTPMLNPKQSSDLAALRAARGAERDRLYVEQQKAAHQEALDLMEAYSKGGGARSLRTAAAKIAPVVKMHISMLSKM
jgi:putative membrane protein